ncbi:conjugal transfer protein MobB [Chryseobacterium sp. SL1]|uniref:conjugal transfer protein MobB n=1 Tax=Chryseobacterium sp. SL1 TaxID=2995159 RepID=UPI002275B8D7|nr:conjugal transfer protein MobB [Chryseobacterium sp. SL1]MCY1662628.1 relaxase/mobilization nuclease domain-containing protein [Chryseobacterium sp. SL1]
MIAKIGRGENIIGALSYNQTKVDGKKAEILYLHNMAETWNGQYSVSQMARSFEPYLLINHKTEKPVLHISLNPDPKDKVSDGQFKELARQYMKEMGYGNQPFVVFRHNDIDRSHIHIVSVCVDETGKKISDTFEKRRSMKVCRDLEKKFQLIPATEKEHVQNDKIFHLVEHEKGDLKSQIASVIRHLPKYYRFQSLGEYNALLSLFNISAAEVKGQLHGIEKQGLVYFAIDKNGEKISNPFKASLFGKNAGYQMLREHLNKSRDAMQQETEKSILKNAVELAMHMTNDELSFKKQLLEHGINTVVRRTAEGRIYGITFIDHNSKIVSNGSRLGKEFSAGVFNTRWNNDINTETKYPNEGIRKSSSKKSDNPISELRPHDPFQFLIPDNPKNLDDDSLFIEGLGGIFPQLQGDDYEEQLFENRMKKKEKRNTG